MSTWNWILQTLYGLQKFMSAIRFITRLSVPSYICVSKINSSHRNSICVFVENSPVYTLYYILIKLKNNKTFILNLTKISQNIRFLKMLNCVKQKKVKLKKEFRTHSCYFDLFYYNNVLGKAHR